MNAYYDNINGKYKQVSKGEDVVDKIIGIKIKSMRVLLVVLILIRIIMFLLNYGFDIYILIFTINKGVVALLLDITIVLIGTLILNLNKTKMWKRYVINSLAGICIVLLMFVFLLVHSDKDYFYFESPNKSNTLVVEEASFLLSGWCNLYERKAGIFIKKLEGQILTDDGFGPFSSNRYELTWIDNDTVEISYDFGSGAGEYQDILIKFD